MIIGLMGQAGVGKDTAGAVIAAELGGVVLAFADPIKRWCMSALKLREEQLWGKDKEKPIKKSQLRPIDRPGSRRSFAESSLLTWANYLASACCIPPHQAKKVEGRLFTMREWWVNSDIESAMWRWWDGLKTERGLTPRRVMQHFGTEFVRRRLGPRFWIQQGLRISDMLLEGGHRYTRTEGLIEDAKANANAAVITDVRFRNEVLGLKRHGGEVYGVFRPKLVDTVRRGESVSTHSSEAEQLSVPQFWLNGRFINRFATKAEFEATVRYTTRSWVNRGPVLF